jgi:predicted RNase H-like nuclease
MGWVVVTLGIGAAADPASLEVVTAIAPVLERLRTGVLAAVGLDMPIGLPAAGRRASDAAARARLGARRASLFATPPRPVLDAVDYADALARTRRDGGPGLSIQAFNLLPKMREVAAAVAADLQPALSEVHPETSFAAMAGAPCRHTKRSPAGVHERLERLRPHIPEIDVLVAARSRAARVDDVLDAAAAAWTARRIALGTAEWLGDVVARDERGLRLTIAV